MIALPRYLAPWATQLTLFPEDIALSIGPIVSRIAALVGGWRHDYAPHGTPEGHAGIDTRGRYERLLATEWALLDELPDEFLRRAVSGEHLFLQQTYQDLAAAKQSVVLFDAGPDQLGAPRLVHLAILIVLAQRAAAHDATLHWGAFQDRDRRLTNDVNEPNVRNLLAARSARPVADEDIDAWMACEPLRLASEVWFVGDRHIAEAARERGASTLLVTEVLEPGALARIRVSAASTAQAGNREAILDIPHGPAAVRILRDPFDIHVGERQTTPLAIAPSSNIIFSVDGRKLHVRGVNGELITIQIPNSPRAKVGRPWAFTAPPGHTILAVGQTRSKRRTVVLSQRDDELTLHVLSKKGRTANHIMRHVGKGYRLPRPASDTWLVPLAFFEQRACFVDRAGSLIELGNDTFSPRDKAVSGASRAVHGGLVYVHASGPNPELMMARANPSGEIELSPLQMPLEPLDHARYHFSSYGTSRLLVSADNQTTCVAYGGTEQAEIYVPDTHLVIGMWERGANPAEPFAIAIDANRTEIDVFGRAGWEKLLTTTTRIAFASVSDADSVIGFITVAGELGVYSCRAGRMVLQISGERT